MLEQKLNSNTEDDVTTSSHTCTKPIVVRRYFGLKFIKYVKAL
jgi:hypothetical protein